MLAAGRGVRSSVLRLPMYVWGNNGSYFIPLNIAAAKQHGKAHYILPGGSAPSLQTSIPARVPPSLYAIWHSSSHFCLSKA